MNKLVSNLVFYAQSTIAVISVWKMNKSHETNLKKKKKKKRERERERERERQRETETERDRETEREEKTALGTVSIITNAAIQSQQYLHLIFPLSQKFVGKW